MKDLELTAAKVIVEEMAKAFRVVRADGKAECIEAVAGAIRTVVKEQVASALAPVAQAPPEPCEPGQSGEMRKALMMLGEYLSNIERCEPDEDLWLDCQLAQKGLSSLSAILARESAEPAEERTCATCGWDTGVACSSPRRCGPSDGGLSDHRFWKPKPAEERGPEVGGRRVRCNHCMSIFDEERIDVDAQGPDTGETCPVCSKGDALMDFGAEIEARIGEVRP